MSVTFGLPREYRGVTRKDFERVYSLPCPDCGGHNTYAQIAEKVEADLDCDKCYGMGGDHNAESALYAREADEDGEMNVANANAIYIVQDILNLPHTEVYGGSIEPTALIMRLAVYFDPSRGVVDPSESQAVRLSSEGVSLGCRVINCGRTSRQVDSYISRLRRLADIAIERGAPAVVWG